MDATSTMRTMELCKLGQRRHGSSHSLVDCGKDYPPMLSLMHHRALTLYKVHSNILMEPMSPLMNKSAIWLISIMCNSTTRETPSTTHIRNSSLKLLDSSAGPLSRKLLIEECLPIKLLLASLWLRQTLWIQDMSPHQLLDNGLHRLIMSLDGLRE